MVGRNTQNAKLCRSFYFCSGFWTRSCPHISPRLRPLPVILQGVHHLQENAPPYDPTVGLCPGSWGGLRGLGVFLWARYPCKPSTPTTDSGAREGGGDPPRRVRASRGLRRGTRAAQFGLRSNPETQNPEPSGPHPKPETLDYQVPNSKLETLNRQVQTRDPEPDHRNPLT